MTGRPSSYTQEIADEICERLIEGESLVDVCLSDRMPSRATVYRWMDDDKTFETRCARAREGQADYMDHLILTTARATTTETATADKVKISAYQWRAEKLNARRFGPKVQQEISGPDGGPVQVTRIELVAPDDHGPD